MGRIIVMYEPDDARLILDRENMPPDIAIATLDVPPELEGVDIYQLARKLAEMLLETINNRR